MTKAQKGKKPIVSVGSLQNHIVKLSVPQPICLPSHPSGRFPAPCWALETQRPCKADADRKSAQQEGGGVKEDLSQC